MMGRGLYAKLSPWMVAQADAQAHRRRQHAKLINRTPGNKLVVDDGKALALDILGCRCERAAWLFFPWLPWRTELVDDPTNLPDLGEFIDVKGIPEDRRRLLVPQGKVKPNWAYLLVSAESHPYYWIPGWLWGHEVRQFPLDPMLRSPGHLVDKDELHKTFHLQRVTKRAYAQPEHKPMSG